MKRKIVHIKLIYRRIIKRLKFAFMWSELIRWPYESCERCGHLYKLLWLVEDERWNAVHGDENGCLCIDCFVELANKKGIELYNSNFSIEVFNPFD